MAKANKADKFQMAAQVNALPRMALQAVMELRKAERQITSVLVAHDSNENFDVDDRKAIKEIADVADIQTARTSLTALLNLAKTLPGWENV